MDGCSQEHAEPALVAVFGPPLEASDEVVWWRGRPVGSTSGRGTECAGCSAGGLSSERLLRHALLPHVRCPSRPCLQVHQPRHRPSQVPFSASFLRCLHSFSLPPSPFNSMHFRNFDCFFSSYTASTTIRQSVQHSTESLMRVSQTRQCWCCTRRRSWLRACWTSRVQTSPSTTAPLLPIPFFPIEALCRMHGSF